MNKELYNIIEEVKNGSGELMDYLDALNFFTVEELKSHCDGYIVGNDKLNNLIKGKYPYISELHARNTIQELLNRLETGMSYTWYGAKGIYEQVEKTFIRRSELPTNKEELISWYGEEFITDDVVKFVQMINKE